MVIAVMILFLLLSKYADPDQLPQDTIAQWTLSGLFEIHHLDNNGQCGLINEENGIVLLEAMRYAINKVNIANEQMLFGKRLGYVFYDTCGDAKNAMSIIKNNEIKKRTSSAIIGPPTSSEASMILLPMKLFYMPAVSFSANSMLLDNIQLYNNFFKSLPSYRFELNVVVDILTYHNWTYVHVIHSGDSDIGVIHTFQDMLRTRSNPSICIASEHSIGKDTSSDTYKQIAEEMNFFKKVSIVVLLVDSTFSHRLLTTIKELKIPQKRFIFISTTTWMEHSTQYDDVTEYADGSIVVGHHLSQQSGFFRYFNSLNTTNNNYDYFVEFWENVFNCTINGINARKCSGKESLEDLSSKWKYTPVQFVIESVYAVACALRTVISSVCYNQPTIDACLSDGIKSMILSPPVLWSRLQLFLTRSIQSCPKRFMTDLKFEHGPKPSYKIYQARQNGDELDYKEIGYWRLNTTSYIIDIQINNTELNTLITSHCSKECLPNEIKEIDFESPHAKCCWRCSICNKNQIKVNNTCITCDITQKRNDDQTKCIPFEIVYINALDELPLTILILAAIGVVVTLIITFLFYKHRRTKIIKASGRELCFMMLAGLLTAYFSVLVLLWKPSWWTCGGARVLTGVALTSLYAPLFLKTNRIYRIFSSAQRKVSRPRLISPTSQIAICSSIIAMQVLIGCVWFAEATSPVASYILEKAEVILLTCHLSSLSFVLNLALSFILSCICTWYAFKTRKFPANFNESRTIAVTMFITCLLYAVCITSYLFNNQITQRQWRTFATAAFLLIVSYVFMVGFFGTKIYNLLKQLWFGSNDLPSTSSEVPQSKNSKMTNL